jgi:hypothetical protein
VKFIGVLGKARCSIQLDVGYSDAVVPGPEEDYFDLWVLLRSSAFNTVVLGRAIASTCMRRNTGLPATTPLGLSDEFAQNTTKRRQWSAFLRKNALHAPALENVVEELRDGLAEALIQARSYRQ